MLGRLRDSTEFEFVFGPDTPMEHQRTWLKEQRQSKHHDRYEEVQLWQSDTGRTITHRFRPDAVVVAQVIAPQPPEPPAQEQEAPAAGTEPEDASADFDVLPGQRRGRGRNHR